MVRFGRPRFPKRRGKLIGEGEAPAEPIAYRKSRLAGRLALPDLANAFALRKTGWGVVILFASL
jgi:hypothetical protein